MRARHDSSVLRLASGTHTDADRRVKFDAEIDVILNVEAEVSCCLPRTCSGEVRTRERSSHAPRSLPPWDRDLLVPSDSFCELIHTCLKARKCIFRPYANL